MTRRTLAAVTVVILMAAADVAYANTTLSQVFSQLEQQYGLPSGILAKVANVESGGNPTAGSPGAAYGMFQWLPRSWYDASRALYGRSLDLSERANPVTSAKVTAFALANAKSQIGGLITEAKIDMTLGLYMSHFLGIGGAKKFLQSYLQNPNQNAAAIFPKEAAANRSVFGNRTLAQVLNFFAQRLRVAGVTVNLAGNFADQSGVSLAYSNADVSPSSFMPAGFRPAVPDTHTYPTTYTPSSQAQALQTPAQLSSPVSVSELPASQTGGNATTSAALLIVQPRSVTRGNPVLLSWTSVGMSTTALCQVSRLGVVVGRGNAGSQIVQSASLPRGSQTFTLTCTTQSGQQRQQSAAVIIN